MSGAAPLPTETVRQFPEVVECYLTTGECDAIMRVVTADLHAPPRDTRPVADPGPAAEVVAESVPDSPPTSTSGGRGRADCMPSSSPGWVRSSQPEIPLQ